MVIQAAPTQSDPTHREEHQSMTHELNEAAETDTTHILMKCIMKREESYLQPRVSGCGQTSLTLVQKSITDDISPH